MRGGQASYRMLNEYRWDVAALLDDAEVVGWLLAGGLVKEVESAPREGE